jgi:hemolysin D
MTLSPDNHVSHYSPFWHWSALTLILLPVVAVVTSIFTYVDIVAQGVGRVVPLSAVRPVDSQVAGEIVEVVASPGALVTVGDIILRLDDTELRNGLLKSEQKITQLSVELSRLQAALLTAERHDPSDTDYESFALATFKGKSENSGDIGKMALAKLRAELDSTTASLAETDANIKSLLSEIAGIEAQIVKAKSNLVSESTNIAAAKKLVLTKNIAQLEYLRRLQVFESAKSDLAVLKQLLVSKNAETQSLRQHRKAFVSSKIREWYASYEATQTELSEQHIEGKLFKKRLELMTVRAPATGRLEEFKIRTVGARVSEGQSIGRIVPANDLVEIEVRIPSSESSFLKEQQRVVINLDAYPAERFGSLKGKVRSISADSVQEGTLGWYYVMRVSPSETFLSTSAGKVDLSPGMTVNVNIVTGNRRMISYLFEPILKAFSNGGRER